MFKSDELIFKYEDAEVEIWGLEIAHFNNIDDLQNEVISDYSESHPEYSQNPHFEFIFQESVGTDAGEWPGALRENSSRPRIVRDPFGPLIGRGVFMKLPFEVIW